MLAVCCSLRFVQDLLEVVRQLKASSSAPAMRTEKNPLMNMIEQEPAGDSSSKEVEHMETSVHTISRRFNEIRIAADRKQAELDRLQKQVENDTLKLKGEEEQQQRQAEE